MSTIVYGPARLLKPPDALTMLKFGHLQDIAPKHQ